MVSDEEADGADEIARVLSDLQSLGDNCEFGLVQRYGGCEPLGLFRFTTAPLGPVVHALDNDLAGYGDDGDLDIVVGPYDLLCCVSRRYGFIYSTGEHAGSVDTAALLAREYRKVAYLRRRLLEDLAAGEKIFVRKGPDDERDADVAALVRAVRRHGACPFLRVARTQDPSQVGSVHARGDGVFEGYVRRFSPYEGGMDIDLEPWLAVLRAAHGHVRGAQGMPPPLPIEAIARRFDDRAVAHEAGGAQGMTIRSAAFASAGLKPGAVHVFSVFVWIPAGFTGERVFTVFGRTRLAFRDADPSFREAWQRVWVSAALPPGSDDLRLGLGGTGPGRSRFWSTGWQLSRGPLPPPAPVPSLAPPRGLAAWWAGWRPG